VRDGRNARPFDVRHEDYNSSRVCNKFLLDIYQFLLHAEQDMPVQLAVVAHITDVSKCPCSPDDKVRSQ